MGYDYLIVGQGLAGSVLAETFIKNGKRVLVVEREEHRSASDVAAGIYNPITGKRMVKTWKANEIFPFLENFYSSLEKKMGEQILFKMPIYKPFGSIVEQNFWISQTGFTDNEDILKAVSIPQYPNAVEDSAGGLITKLSGFLDVSKMLKLFRVYLKKENAYLKGNIAQDELEIKESEVRWKDKTAGKIIFCEGYSSVNNWLFRELPFVPAKGELLTVCMPHFPENTIVNKDIFILPLGNHRYKIGATYKWDFKNNDTTDEATEELILKLKKLIKVPYTIETQLAGIRPTVKDRRPLLGLHPQHKSVGIFNGLGTKGVSLAPYFADHFYQFLENGKKIDPEVDIERFLTQ